MSSFQDTCELIWTPPEPGLYSVAVQLEDFAPGFPYQKLSEVPLQFLIHASHSDLACSQRPVFQDTPLQPNCFAVPRGATFTFDIYATHVAYPTRTWACNCSLFRCPVIIMFCGIYRVEPRIWILHVQEAWSKPNLEMCPESRDWERRLWLGDRMLSSMDKSISSVL